MLLAPALYLVGRELMVAFVCVCRTDACQPTRKAPFQRPPAADGNAAAHSGAHHTRRRQRAATAADACDAVTASSRLPYQR